jgi:hypothetical protein
MPMRLPDIDQILSGDVFATVGQRFGEWEKMPEAALPNPRRILRRARNNPWPRCATFRCREWFESLGGRQKPLIVRNPAARNLALAARPDVGHIDPTGDVAEWLKAAVC